MKIVIAGLSITSSWGNGHATTFRSLVRNLKALGHDVLFLERDVPWYRDNRDQPAPPGCRLGLYRSLGELQTRWWGAIAEADAVIVGSYVPDGVEVGRWITRVARGVTAFYDIDTPVTLAKLERDDFEYLTPDLIRRYDLYLSFTGGPILERLEQRYGAQRARALYCSVDPELYQPTGDFPTWDLGYLGTYSEDRQPKVEALLLEVARQRPRHRFVIGGPSYPHPEAWPKNVQHVPHVPPAEHAAFYGRQRWTLNVTRADMVAAGHSPSVRLFEAAACGVPILSDVWPGIEELFEPDRELVLVRTTDDVVAALRDIDEHRRLDIAMRARERVLASHTGRHRAEELVTYLTEARAGLVGAK